MRGCLWMAGTIFVITVVGSRHQATAAVETIGSPLVKRQVTDVDFGQVCFYDGTSAPFQTAGAATSWQFFDDRNGGNVVTPFLLRITGDGTSFTVTGIGTTRTSTGAGLQSYAFGLIAGSAAVTAGDTTFGFTNRAYTASGGTPVAGGSNTGVIPFDRPGPTVPNDPWLVTAQVSTPGAVNLQIGTVFGAGGITIYNPQDPTGLDRVYSAQMTVPEPGMFAVLTSAAAALVAPRRRRRRRSA